MRFVTALALIAFATPAIAQEAPASVDQAARPEKSRKDKNDPDRQICRRVGATGSRLSARPECHTKAEWDQMSRNNQNALGNRDSGVGNQ
jgi:hypothetical protein